MKQLVLLLGIIACGILSGCSGSTTSTADAGTVDTTTKTLASNTSIDNTKTRLTATTVQGALEEIAPATFNSTSIVGSWTAYNYNNGSSGSSGVVSFNSNGTFQLTSGAVLSMELNGTQATGKWQIIKGTFIETQLDGIDPLGSAPYYKRYLYPLVVSPTKLIVMRDTNITIFEKQ